MIERSDADGSGVMVDDGLVADEIKPMDQARQLLFHGQLLDLAAAMRPMPIAVSGLSALMADPDCSIDDVAEELRSDPNLVAAVLREANSAASAPVAGISSIQAAVTRVGLARVLAIAAGSMLGPAAQCPLEAYQLGPGGLWDHSVISSYVAEAIYKMGRDGIGPEVVAAALLHDIGMIILDGVLEPSHFRSAMMINLTSDAAERELVDVDHAEMGAVLLEMWNLPASITHPIRFHHTPDLAGLPGAHVINIASIIADELGRASKLHELGIVDPMLDTSLEALGLDRDSVVDGAVKLIVQAGRARGQNGPELADDAPGPIRMPNPPWHH